MAKLKKYTDPSKGSLLSLSLGPVTDAQVAVVKSSRGRKRKQVKKKEMSIFDQSTRKVQTDLLRKVAHDYKLSYTELIKKYLAGVEPTTGFELSEADEQLVYEYCTKDQFTLEEVIIDGKHCYADLVNSLIIYDSDAKPIGLYINGMAVI